MLKKTLCFSIILFLGILSLNISYATDVLMNLNNTTNSTENSSQTVDNTTYSSDNNTSTSETETQDSNYQPSASTTTTDYEDSSELSVSNMINIILIVVGIILILLGIAIIIKLNK